MKAHILLLCGLLGSGFAGQAQWLLSTSPATNITSATATLNGGGDCKAIGAIGECVKGGSRGFVWGMGSNPAVGTTTVSVQDLANPIPVAFTANIGGLTESTTYNYWVFHKNSSGVIKYGNMVSFRTHALASPTTNPVTEIKAMSATGNGNLSTMWIFGNPMIAERGFLWNTTTNRPSINVISKCTTTLGTNDFSCGLTGLQPNTQYYVWAYAKYSNGTHKYGDPVSFTTPTPPTVTTSAATATGYTTATCGGNVTSAGTFPVTARGVCWSTSGTPTTSSSKTTDGSGTGAFTSNMTGLQDNTTYTVRAYAISEAGPAYGEPRSVTTPKKVYPTVNAGNDITITLPTSSVTLNGTASDADGSIASRSWTRVSGSGTIASANTLSTLVNGLAEGVSTFQLSATDNTGLVSTDDVKVTVNPPPRPDLTVKFEGSMFTTAGGWNDGVLPTDVGTFGLCTYAQGSASKTTTIGELKVTVTNAGLAATTTTCTVKVTHGTNTNVADQTFTVPVLAVGASRTFIVARTENRVCATKTNNPVAQCTRCLENVLPWWSDKGLSAKADNGSVITESNETNNSASIP